MTTSVSSADLEFLRSSVTNNQGTNGGKPTKTADSNLLFNGGFSLDPSEQATGVKLFRKAYHGTTHGKITGTTESPANPDEELSFKNPVVACSRFDTPNFYVFFLTQGATIEEEFEARQSHIPVNTAGTPTGRLYGVGSLTQSAALGSSSITLDARRGDLQPFRAGDLLCFSRSYWQTRAGSPRWIVTSDSSLTWYERVSATAVTYLNDVATIALASPLNHDIRKNSFVSVGIKRDEYITNHTGAITVTRGSGNSSTGTYDGTTYPIVVHPAGGIAQRWTLSFVSNFAFNLIGDTLGTVGGGNISSDFIPINPLNNKPYFTLDNAGFQGTWQTGDTITFYSFTQVRPFWVYVEVPANSEPSNDVFFDVLVNNG